MEKSLSGAIAIITGSDSGIGQATAVEFARQGAGVLVHYYEDGNRANSTREQVEALGAKATVVQGAVKKNKT